MQEHSPATHEIPSAVIGALLADNPEVTGQIIRTLWLGGITITGRITETGTGDMRLDAVTAARCAALAAEIHPPFVDRLVRNATSVVDPLDRADLHAAATMALGRPPVLRWITANASAVATDPGWREMLVGLGGVTVSVPLAEEALYNIAITKQRLPGELTASIQLNPWYSQRFATRYRRTMKGKRIRVWERAATSRGWSHARTSIGTRLPEQWRSLHGRGVGRPLDRWSSKLLATYAELILKTFADDGVPAVVAPLLVVAAAVTPEVPIPEHVATRWVSLPHDVEAAARRLVRLGPRQLDPAEVRQVSALRRACATYGNDPAAWRDLGAAFATSHTFAV